MFSCPRSRQKNWSRETGSAVPSHVGLLILHTRAVNLVLTHGIPPDFRGGVHFFILIHHTPSSQSRIYRVTQLRIDGVHCRESAGTGPIVVLKIVPVTDAITGAAFAGLTMDQLEMCASVFPHLNNVEVKISGGMCLKKNQCIVSTHEIQEIKFPLTEGCSEGLDTLK